LNVSSPIEAIAWKYSILKTGVAEWCYEAIAGKPEESFMAFRNHIAIQQRLTAHPQMVRHG
jgi:hypothetical protein